jgi:beta-N-acetylhexosaminidase
MSQLQRCDLVPFRAAVEAGVECLMTSHIWYRGIDAECTPASTSPGVFALARKDLAFDGPIFSDDMEMLAIQRRWGTGPAVVRALAAGCDLPIVSHRIDRQHEALRAISSAVESGDLSVGRLEEAARRADAVRDSLRGRENRTPRINLDELARMISFQALTLVRDSRGLLPLLLSPGARILVVSFSAPISIGEETSVRTHLARRVKERWPYVTEVIASEETNTDQIADRARSADTIVIGTVSASLRPVQAEIVRRLHATGTPTVVVALRGPFDLLEFPEIDCFLAAYDESVASAEAIAEALFEEREFAGRLPVQLPALYPRGHGLTTNDRRLNA